MGTAPSPWDIDYFNPPTPHIPAPSPRAKTPKPVPDIQDLFRVQRNTLKVVNDLEDLQRHLRDHKDPHVALALRRLIQDADNAYKVINTYLRHQTEGTL